MFPLKMQHDDVVWQKHKEMGSREGKKWKREVQKIEDGKKGEFQITEWSRAGIYLQPVFVLSCAKMVYLESLCK